jgi:hypothetical protein
MLKILMLSLLLYFNSFAMNEYKETEVKSVISKKIVIADRLFVSNTLVDIFGNKARKYTDKFIMENVSFFGGPCDIYEQIRPDERSIKDQTTSCYNRKSNSKELLNPRSSLLRSGNIVKTCTAITTDKDVMKLFFDQFKMKKKKHFNEEVLKKLHNIFYPLDPITKNQLDKLKLLFNISPSQDRWNILAYTYCLSPDWRVL